LALEHKMLPASLHYQQANTQIDFANSPFYVNSQLRVWPDNGKPRRAGVSSFGVGGTNAHVIVEEWHSSESSSRSREWQVLLLSGKSEAALTAATKQLGEYLQQHREVNLADVAYTLQLGRKHFNYRRMVICRDIDNALSALTANTFTQCFSDPKETDNCPVVFMFTGQGSQYLNMGLELYQTEPVFRQYIDQCAEILKIHLGIDLRTILYPKAEEAEKAAQQLDQTWITQPALFVLEYSLARLWISWGIYPEAMIGHSIGEYVAACLAEVFTLADALALVSIRGRLMQELPAGAMLAVPMSEDEIKVRMTQEISIAAINTPSLCVVSGPVEEISAWQEELTAEGLICRPLNTSHAFHSQMMSPIVEEFITQVKQIKLDAPQIPYISNVTGNWITAAEASNADYWGRHLRQTVMFSQGLQEILKSPRRVLLEIGPAETLSRLAARHPANDGNTVTVATLGSRNDRITEPQQLLTALGQLWLARVPIDWTKFYTNERRHRVVLPTYPFERQRYWIETRPTSEQPHKKQSALIKNEDISDWFYYPTFRSTRLLNTTNILVERKRWLIFDKGDSFSNALVEHLQTNGQQVVRVKVGKQFTHIDNDIYTIDPNKSEDYKTLINKLLVLQNLPDYILHLWSITPTIDIGSEPFERLQSLGFYSLLFLAQALDSENITEPIRIGVITNHIVAVTDEEILHTEKVTIFGPCKVIPQEYPYITCHCIDIYLPKTGAQPELRILNQIIAEISLNSPDVIVAYRGNQRWVQSFEPVKLNSIEKIPQLRSKGVYLIISGLSDIGFALAEYLAKHLCAKLVFVEESAFPAKQLWEQQLINQSDDTISDKIKRIKLLEDLGAEVLIINATLTSEIQMHTALSQAVERFGKINGVIYTLEADRQQPFQFIPTINVAEIRCHFESIAYGLSVLEKVLVGRELDFCLMSSSLSAILGGLGTIAYTSAYLFMDAFVYNHNKKTCLPWISVNWDVWQLQHKQTVATNTNLHQLVIDTAEGVEVFRRILPLDQPSQIIVSTGDLTARIEQWLKPKSLPDRLLKENSAVSTVCRSRPQIEAPYIAPDNELETVIADIWQKAFGIDKVGVQDNFFDLGGDSLMAIQVISQLRKRLNIEIPVVSLYERLTVRSLAELLYSDQNDVDGIDTAQTSRREVRIQKRREIQQKQRLKRELREQRF
ncbi:MAG: acyltransferase domain-containing protein, partial [Acidobacteriota bacterium]